MKVLLINNYHYRKGGADGVYFNTAQLLQQQGHKVTYFSTSADSNLKGEENNYFVKSNDFRNIPATKKIGAAISFVYNKEAYNNLLKLLEEIKPDIAHIHLFMGALSSSILKALNKKKIPVIHTVHDYRLICPAYLFIDGKNKICEKCKDGFYLHCLFNRCSENNLSQSAILSFEAYFRKYIVKPSKLIDQFVFVSKFSEQKHLDFNQKFRQKSEVLYNFNPRLGSIQPDHNKGKYFLYFGRISREKGILTLLESALNTGIELKIAGTGPLLGQLTNKESKHVQFLGYQTGDELWSIIRAASFVVVPSEWYENNPLTIVEAYSFGKPVIGARIGGIPELVIENSTGYLFTPGDKGELEEKLLKAQRLSPEEYSQMSANARRFADRNFNPEDHYKKLLQIYQNVTNHKTTL